MFWLLRDHIDEGMGTSTRFRLLDIDEGMGRQASLMFWLLRVQHRRGHGQAGDSYVSSTSRASSTKAWTGRRPQGSGYFGGYIDEGMGRQASLMFPLLRGLH